MRHVLFLLKVRLIQLFLTEGIIKLWTVLKDQERQCLKIDLINWYESDHHLTTNDNSGEYSDPVRVRKYI